MITDNSGQDIDSIEEFTIRSLDKSQDGLDDLLEESRKCGKLLVSKKAKQGLNLMYSLVESLYTFDVFTQELCALFQIDGYQIKDSNGNLHDNIDLFHSTLNRMATELEKNSLESLSDILCNDLPASLLRHKELLPILRAYINEEYMQPCS